MQNINLINYDAMWIRRENERKRKEVVARIERETRERKQAAALQDAQARLEALTALCKEVRRHFMQKPWATEELFNEAWKKDSLSLIREYEQSQLAIQRM